MATKRKSLVIGGLVVGVVLAIVSLLSTASGATGSVQVVRTGHALGKTVLVNRAGVTLYSLSAETRGRFICTGACVSTWHPLVVKRGQKPAGAHSLGTIRRPDGKTQVTYRGKPLYTFAGDHKPGDANGEGFKDVGTWHAATVKSSSSQPAMPAPQPTPSYPSY